jgi:hypothetical protein
MVIRKVEEILLALRTPVTLEMERHPPPKWSIKGELGASDKKKIDTKADRILKK